MRTYCIAQGTLLNAFDLDGKEIQNRRDIFIHIADSFYLTVESNTTL